MTAVDWLAQGPSSLQSSQKSCRPSREKGPIVQVSKNQLCLIGVVEGKGFSLDITTVIVFIYIRRERKS